MDVTISNKAKRKKAPCYKCQERVPGCHGKCELYAEWRRPFERAKDARRSGAEADMFRHDGVKRSISRRYKQNGHY